MRAALNENEEMSAKLEKIEKNTDKLFKVVFERLDDLEIVRVPNLPKRRIGI